MAIRIIEYIVLMGRGAVHHVYLCDKYIYLKTLFDENQGRHISVKYLSNRLLEHKIWYDTSANRKLKENCKYVVSCSYNSFLTLLVLLYMGIHVYIFHNLHFQLIINVISYTIQGFFIPFSA